MLKRSRRGHTLWTYIGGGMITRSEVRRASRVQNNQVVWHYRMSLRDIPTQSHLVLGFRLFLWYSNNSETCGVGYSLWCICERESKSVILGHRTAHHKQREDPLALSAYCVNVSLQGAIWPGAQVHREVHRPHIGSQDHQSEEHQGAGEASVQGQPKPLKKFRTSHFLRPLSRAQISH